MAVPVRESRPLSSAVAGCRRQAEASPGFTVVFTGSAAGRPAGPAPPARRWRPGRRPAASRASVCCQRTAIQPEHGGPGGQTRTAASTSCPHSATHGPVCPVSRCAEAVAGLRARIRPFHGVTAACEFDDRARVALAGSYPTCPASPLTRSRAPKYTRSWKTTSSRPDARCLMNPEDQLDGDHQNQSGVQEGGIRPSGGGSRSVSGT